MEKKTFWSVLGKQEKPSQDIKLILLSKVTIIQVHDMVEFKDTLNSCIEIT